MRNERDGLIRPGEGFGGILRPGNGREGEARIAMPGPDGGAGTGILSCQSPHDSAFMICTIISQPALASRHTGNTG